MYHENSTSLLVKNKAPPSALVGSLRLGLSPKASKAPVRMILSPSCL